MCRVRPGEETNESVLEDEYNADSAKCQLRYGIGKISSRAIFVKHLKEDDLGRSTVDIELISSRRGYEPIGSVSAACSQNRSNLEC